MPKAKLTQKLIDNARNEQGKRKTDIFDTEMKGLIVEVRDNGKTYYLRYQDQRGKTHQKKLADASVLRLSDARKLAQEKLSLIAMGNDPFEAKKALKDVLTVAEFVSESYMPFIKGYKRSWNTDESHLRNHILPAIGHLYMDEVKRQHMVNLFSQHKSTHKAGSTNRIIILCRFLFNCAIRWEVSGIERNPTKGIDMYPENNKLERFITKEEAQKLFQALENSESKMLKYFISMLLLTGARKSEVLHAKWEDFDFANRRWTVEFNKTGKPRYIPLSDGAIALLQTVPRLEGCKYAFPNLKTGLPYVHVHTSWDTARKKAGLPDVRIHDLRHSFASFLINNGRSLYEVQKILGHTQVKTTQRYVHLSQDSLISAANTVSSLISVIPTSAQKINLITANQSI